MIRINGTLMIFSVCVWAEDQMIILGTDGLWELGNQEVVDICLAAG